MKFVMEICKLKMEDHTLENGAEILENVLMVLAQKIYDETLRWNSKRNLGLYVTCDSLFDRTISKLLQEIEVPQRSKLEVSVFIYFNFHLGTVSLLPNELQQSYFRA